MEGADPLAALRDIHLPAPPADPGSGWLSLILLAASAVIAGAVLVHLLHRRRSWRAEAAALLREIDLARPDEALAQMAAVLRRIALRADRTKAAHLSGEDWLRHLDGLFASSYFTAGPGRVFGDLYRPAAHPPDVAGIRITLSRLIARGRFRRW